MGTRTDDFTPKTKRLLASRVGHHCSNPECRALTIGPGLGPDKTVNSGDAAHITAASPGGPRFDPLLTAEQRRSEANGIWLCVTHARLIDQDSSRYSVEVLRRWKADAEKDALVRLGSPQSIRSRSPEIESFAALAQSLIVALKTYEQQSASLGIEGPVKQLAVVAALLGIPVPIEIRTLSYPEGIEPQHPFLRERFEGSCTIRFPDGSYESGTAAHASGLELLVEARESAIVALEQWVIMLGL